MLHMLICRQDDLLLLSVYMLYNKECDVGFHTMNLNRLDLLHYGGVDHLVGHSLHLNSYWVDFHAI